MIKKIKNYLGIKQVEDKIIRSPEDFMIVDRIITLLTNEPERFSANWFNEGLLDSSIKLLGEDILISVHDYKIFYPVKIIQTKEECESIKRLIQPILNKSRLESKEFNDKKKQEIFKRLV